MNFDVCLTPALLPITELRGKTVVVADILRATSSMVAGLASGVASIIPVASVEECMNVERDFNTLISGERNGEKLEGFDLGNSPFEFMNAVGKEIVMTTTNGTQAIEQSKTADLILIGAFINLQAVAEEVKRSERDVVVVCAGWKGQFNLEDTLFAGALFEELSDCITGFSDASLAAQALYRQAKKDMIAFLQNSSHFIRLEHKKMSKDIEFCFSLNLFDVVPVFEGKKLVLSEQCISNK
jgi:2-phosphosulfolactate phosphatase